MTTQPRCPKCNRLRDFCDHPDVVATQLAEPKRDAAAMCNGYCATAETQHLCPAHGKPAAPSHGTEAHIAVHAAKPAADERPAREWWIIRGKPLKKNGTFWQTEIAFSKSDLPPGRHAIRVREVKKNETA